MVQSIDTGGILSQMLEPIDTEELYLGICITDTGGLPSFDIGGLVPESVKCIADTEGLASVDIGGIVSGTEAGLSKTSQSMDMCDLVLGIFLSFCII